MTMVYDIIPSPLGDIVLIADDNHLYQISLTQNIHSRYSNRIAKAKKQPIAQWINTKNSITQKAATQLQQYFSGGRTSFDLPLGMIGTDFQQRVWRALLDIPFGETRSYLQIADTIGMPNAVRAVANANGANALPIIIPCHRVIGSNGRLTGYSGGLEKKEKLLAVENLFVAR